MVLFLVINCYKIIYFEEFQVKFVKLLKEESKR